MIHSASPSGIPSSGDTSALAALVDRLDPGMIDHTPATLKRYARSSSGQPITPLAVACPTTTEQVQSIVKIASAHRLPVYPISRGRNFGYGDACAPAENYLIIDFARMNRIIEVNKDLAYAVIEPGVTQGQLAAFLREQRTGLWADCTGAGLDASLLGNTLDRGFGHTPYGDHAGHSCGMQVVMADGSLLNTGMGHFPNSQTTYAYSHGVGPELEGLFAQSNLGIVTRIGIWLMPEPEAFCAFFVQPRDDGPDALRQLIDGLAPLRKQGLLTSAIHIGNDLRLISGRMGYPWQRTGGKTPLPDDVRRQIRREQSLASWQAGGGIYGTRRTVAAVKHEIRRSLRGWRVRFIDDRKLALATRVQQGLSHVGLGRRLGEQLAWLAPVYGLMKGQPTNDPLTGMLWRVRGKSTCDATDPLAAHAGLMWVSPVLPNTAEAAKQVLEILEPTYAKYGFENLVTFTMITERAMIAISNLAFDTREADEARRAHACYDELYDKLMAAGFIPYRAGHHGQQRLCAQDSVFWQVAGRIKKALDPDQIISPGRYIPASHARHASQAPPPNETDGQVDRLVTGQSGL